MDNKKNAKFRWYLEREMEVIEHQKKQTTDEYRLAVLRGRSEGVRKSMIYFNNIMTND